MTFLSAILFVCNRTCNFFSLPHGIYLKLERSSSRTIAGLSACGMSVSQATIGRALSRLSKDAEQTANTVINGPRKWFIVFDNINIYLKKFQQRLRNQNYMIHATNLAIVTLPQSISNAAFNLAAYVSLRGKRSEAKKELHSLRLSKDESDLLRQASKAEICNLLMTYAPG